jgi:hypothetical protein
MRRFVQIAGHPQVVDLVLDPFSYEDVLGAQAERGQLNSMIITHLAQVLPLAIAQLDAVGDVYGALALEGLQSQLVRHAVTA